MLRNKAQRIADHSEMRYAQYCAAYEALVKIADLPIYTAANPDHREIAKQAIEKCAEIERKHYV